MRGRWLAIALGMALPLWQLPTRAADDRPQSQPIRDVTVEYRLINPQQSELVAIPRTLKVYWVNGGALMRIEMAGERSYVILDRKAKLMTVVMLDDRSYVQLPYDPAKPTGFTVPPGIPLTRAGTEVVVGNPCTVWVQKTEEGSSRMCISDDGVLLHAQGRQTGRPDELEATSIIYGPPAPSLLVPPVDFKKVNPPRSAAGARPPG